MREGNAEACHSLFSQFETIDSPNYKIIIFSRKHVLAFALKGFQNNYLEFTLKGDFFQSQSISRLSGDFGPI